jgi:hypothetical protein
VTVGFPSGTYIATAMYGWTTSGPVALTSTATDRFTPCSWGATADGMTDGTAAIQDAVNAVQGTNPGSYTIFFPSGQNAYLVSTGITFAGNLSHAIRFLGEASSELGGAWLAWGGPSNTDGSESQVMLTLSTASGFRFEHMLFSGQLPTNPTPGVTGPQYLVWIRENAYPPGTGSTEHGIFHDCTFQGSYGPGSGCVAIGDRTGGDIAQIVWRECVFQGVFGPLVSGSITGATNAAPIQITTSANHGLSTGSAVLITGVGGNRAANGDWYVVVTGLTTFTLNDSTGSGAYTSGGTFTCAATTEYGIKFNNQVGNNLIFRMSDCQWQIFRRANIKCVSSVASLIIDNPSISNVTGGPPASGLIADWYIGPYIELTILGGRSEGSGRIVYSYPIFDILGSCTIQGHNWNGASIDFSFDPLGEASQAFQDVAIYWTGSLRLIGNRIWNQRGDATHPPNIIVAADPGPIGVVSGLGFDGAIFSQGNHYYNSTFLPFYDGSGGNLLAEWQDFAKAGEASLFSRFDIGGQDGALIRFPSYEGQNSRVGPQQLLVQTSSLASARFSKVNAGILAHSVAKFGVDSTDIQTGSTNMTITLGLLPARARIINVIANTTTTYQGGPVTAVTCSVGGAGTTDYLAAHDVKTAVVTKGLVTGDMGTLLLPSHNNTIGYLPSFSDSSAVTATYISEGANLSALRQGHSDFYITFEVLPH